MRLDLWVIATIAFLNFLACRACPGDHGRAQGGKVFRIAMWEPETLDPSLAAEEASVTITRALFEGLLRPPLGNGPPRPAVAERYEVSEDGRRYVFHLRPNARWSDGKAVVAGDFLYSWRRALDPSTGSRNAFLFYVIEGAQDFHEGRVGPEGLSVQAPDDSTLIVRLRTPAPYFPYLLTYPAFAPLRRDVVEAYGPSWALPGRLVGNGAFVLEDYKAKVGITVRKNPYYWNAQEVGIEGVDFAFFDVGRGAYDWFVLGRVDWLKGTLSRDEIIKARVEVPQALHTDDVLCTYYVVLNVRSGALQDERLRKALDLAIDKERLVTEVLMGGQSPARSFVPTAIQAVTGYRPPLTENFDPALARSLLAQVEAERGPPKGLVWLYNNSDVHRLIGEFLQAQWRRNLGLDVALEAVEWKVLLERVQRGDYVMARASWCADYPDEGNFIEVFHSHNPSNYAGFSDPEVDSLVERARNEKDKEIRSKTYQSAERRILEARPIIPLYHYTRVYLLNPKVRGFEPNILDVHPLEDIKFLE